MLRVETEGPVTVLTLDRPEAKNALSRGLLARLLEAFSDLARDPGVRAVVLTGAGGAFASGGDLRELREVTSAVDAQSFAELGVAVCAAIEALPVPVVAAIEGPAFGGGAELALACDLRVADASTRVCFKHARMGVSTAWGTLARLVSLVGHGVAGRLLYTAEELSGAEARALGLVELVATDGTAREAAVAWGGQVALGSPLAIAEMKALLVAARAPRPELSTDERARFVRTWTSEDHQVAVEAYFARTAPRWPARG